MKPPKFFVQWQGTTVCGDFRCVCGAVGHVCGQDFMFALRCTKCGAVYRVPSNLQLEPLPESERLYDLTTVDVEDFG